MDDWFWRRNAVEERRKKSTGINNKVKETGEKERERAVLITNEKNRQSVSLPEC